jgi:DEAD/DEAH box helicase domain-containing protein
MKRVVFDIETSNLFSDVGSNDPADLNLSVVCIYEYDTDTYSSFLQEDLGKLWLILEKTDLLIGYNSDHFDVPLLNKYYPGDLTKIKSMDILREIRATYGRRMKLDQIAEGTLGTNKTSEGLQAVRWWREGEVQKVIDYCIADVRITKDVYDYALANNKLIFKEGGELLTIPLNTSEWEKKEESVMTHTLPF